MWRHLGDYRKDWEDWEYFGEELELGNVLNQIVHLVGIFAISILWVIFLARVVGPILP
ncbi:MAG: hypothetical protein AB1556_05150 [Bacillota bacterium]